MRAPWDGDNLPTRAGYALSGGDLPRTALSRVERAERSRERLRQGTSDHPKQRAPARRTRDTKAILLD
jgi:hypothetical protein